MRKPLLLFMLALASALTPVMGAERSYTPGIVIGAADGDTCTILLLDGTGGTAAVHLAGVDVSPLGLASDRNSGAEAFLDTLAGCPVWLETGVASQSEGIEISACLWVRGYPAGREIGEAEIRESMVNAWLVLKGYAGVKEEELTRSYAEVFLSLQEEAQRNRLGLWSNGQEQEGIGQEITVYVGKSGSKYHRSGCRYLSKSCLPLSLEEAKAKGYTPCSVCKPPQ